MKSRLNPRISLTATQISQVRHAASAATKTRILAGVLLLIVAPALAHAQGCTQCLDSTRATPPAVQAAYRHAILLMVGAASALFIAGVIFIRREP